MFSQAYAFMNLDAIKTQLSAVTWDKQTRNIISIVSNLLTYVDKHQPQI